jgi:hypothetical protein
MRALGLVRWFRWFRWLGGRSLSGGRDGRAGLVGIGYQRISFGRGLLASGYWLSGGRRCRTVGLARIGRGGVSCVVPQG